MQTFEDACNLRRTSTFARVVILRTLMSYIEPCIRYLLEIYSLTEEPIHDEKYHVLQQTRPKHKRACGRYRSPFVCFLDMSAFATGASILIHS